MRLQPAGVRSRSPAPASTIKLVLKPRRTSRRVVSHHVLPPNLQANPTARTVLVPPPNGAEDVIAFHNTLVPKGRRTPAARFTSSLA
jgi:hypothetical protein